jgi:hypothetical protein
MSFVMKELEVDLNAVLVRLHRRLLRVKITISPDSSPSWIQRRSPAGRFGF